MKKHITGLLLLFLFAGLYATDNFYMGEKLFKENSPEEAIPYLRMAILEPGVNVNVYNYLGLSYYQVGKLQESLETFLKGTTVNGTDKRQLFFNAGNSAFALGQYDKAEEFYSYSLAANPEFAGAVLNRANSYFKLTKYQEAIDAYRQYLTLEPDSDQKDMILKLIGLLEQEIVFQEEEKARIAAEKEKQKEEEARIAAEMAKYEEERRAQEAARAAEEAAIAAAKAAEEERIRAEEAKRRQDLLDEVAQTLQEKDSTNISAGSEGVITYDYEEELD